MKKLIERIKNRIRKEYYIAMVLPVLYMQYGMNYDKAHAGTERFLGFVKVA